MTNPVNYFGEESTGRDIFDFYTGSGNQSYSFLIVFTTKQLFLFKNPGHKVK